MADQGTCIVQVFGAARDEFCYQQVGDADDWHGDAIERTRVQSAQSERFKGRTCEHHIKFHAVGMVQRQHRASTLQFLRDVGEAVAESLREERLNQQRGVGRFGGDIDILRCPRCPVGDHGLRTHYIPANTNYFAGAGDRLQNLTYLTQASLA